MEWTRVRSMWGMPLVLALAAFARGDLLETFDPVTVPAVASQYGNPPTALVLPADAGSSGDFLRLINDGVGNNRNFYNFDQTDVGGFPTIVAEFDFRGSNTPNPADGFSLRFIPTWLYGTTGPGTPGGSPIEKPNLADVFAIGFDFYPEGTPTNDVSVHWDGVERANVTIPTATLDLNSGQFHRARVDWNSLGGASDVSVSIIPDINGTPGAPVPVVTNLIIPGLAPYDHRVELAGRTGGADMSVDLDNVNVAYTAPTLEFFQDFEGGGTPATLSQISSAPGPQNQGADAGSTGTFLRLVNNGVNDQRNAIAFDQAYEQAVAGPNGVVTFDFRANSDPGPADGFSMLFLPTSIYGTTGPGAASAAWAQEEPNVADVLAVGFDFYDENGGVNDVSVHWNGAELANVRLPNSILDLNSGQFHQAQVVWTTKDGESNVRVAIVPDINGTPGDPITVVAGVHVPTTGLYSHRVEFAGRTGGLNMNVDLDNMAADYSLLVPREFFQDFEGIGGTPAATVQVGSAPRPMGMPADAGSTGGFLRLTNDGVNGQNNGIAFDQAINQAQGNPVNIVHTIDFDFRATSLNAPAADGFSILFLPSDLYGTTGPGAAGTFTAEEPNIPGVLGIGFDLHPAATVNDLSLHWDGAELLNLTLPTSDIDLDAGVFHHATITWEGIPGGSLVSVSLIPDINGLIGAEITPIQDYFIPGLTAYPYRLEFAGRTGGLNVGIDLDNISAVHVPEPGTLTLCGLGLLALARRRRRQR